MAKTGLLSDRYQTKPKRKAPRSAFKPGQSGNPSGRPKKDRELTAAIEASLDKQALADKLIELALAGDMQAIKYVYDRIEGSPTQRHEVSHDDLLADVRREAQSRGFSDADVERAVKSAQEMLDRG